MNQDLKYLSSYSTCLFRGSDHTMGLLLGWVFYEILSWSYDPICPEKSCCPWKLSFEKSKSIKTHKTNVFGSHITRTNIVPMMMVTVMKLLLIGSLPTQNCSSGRLNFGGSFSPFYFRSTLLFDKFGKISCQGIFLSSPPPISILTISILLCQSSLYPQLSLKPQSRKKCFVNVFQKLFCLRSPIIFYNTRIIFMLFIKTLFFFKTKV